MSTLLRAALWLRCCICVRFTSPLLPPTSLTIATISPMPPSASRPRSRPMPARSPSRWRRCGATPTRPLPATTSAPACRRSARSSPVAPADAANWLRLARAILQITAGRRPRARRAARARRDRRLYRLSAHRQRAARRPMRSSCSGAALPTARCGARRSTRCACRSSCARSPTCAPNTSGCATITASACSIIRSISDSASPRACFQFSEELPGKRTDFSPFVGCRRPGQAGALGRRQAALRRRAQARRALRHHAARRPALDREGDAGQVGRLLHLCARPQPVRRASPARPMCCRAPASAASRWSASTPPRSPSRSTGSATATCSIPWSARTSSAISTATTCERLADERGVAVWNGAAQGRSPLNTEVTTAFPVDQAVGDLSPGVYVMSAEAAGPKSRRLRRARHPMVHRLRSRPHGLLRQ